MANIGANKGRTLRLALSRFAAMLIEEAKDISGFTFAQLDEELGLCEGQCQRYLIFPPKYKTRAPQADEIQNLENLVARLLKRPAHVVVMEDHSRYHGRNDLLSVIIGPPDAGINLREVSKGDLQLGYEDDWPTYKRIKPMFTLYAWQYGILWERGVLPPPWTSESLQTFGGIPLDSVLRAMVRATKLARLENLILDQEKLGIVPEICRNRYAILSGQQ